MMDAALQASIGLKTEIETAGNQANQPMLPFALRELELFGKSSAVMWAWVRYSEGSKSGDKVQKLDIDLCDEAGNVGARLKGFSARMLERKIPTGNKALAIP